MRTWIVLLSFMSVSGLWAGEVPGQITYQGTLKENGVPVNASRTMQFRLTNANGTAVYWSSGNMPVDVAQGLFSAALSPSSVDWENVRPYVEVSVEGQLLVPREPVNSTAYALMCAAVANQTGMIAMFAKDCPAGWSRFGALDGAFPMGGADYGARGGAASHAHTLLQDAAVVGGGPNTIGASSPGGLLGAYPGGSHFLMYPTRSATTDVSSLPPYLTVVFCQKQ